MQNAWNLVPFALTPHEISRQLHPPTKLEDRDWTDLEKIVNDTFSKSISAFINTIHSPILVGTLEKSEEFQASTNDLTAEEKVVYDEIEYRLAQTPPGFTGVDEKFVNFWFKQEAAARIALLLKHRGLEAGLKPSAENAAGFNRVWHHIG